MKKLCFYCFLIVLSFGCKTDPKYYLTLGEIHESDYFYSLDIDYPVLQSTNRKDANVDSFNSEIGHLIEVTKESYTGSALDKVKEVVDESTSKARCLKRMNHDLFCVYRGLYSVRFTIYEYALGAHGNSFFNCYNYSVPDGRRLNGDDIIDRSTPEKLKDLVELLNLYLNDPNDCFDLTGDSIEQNIENINFSTNEVVFSFAHYELGPYACGTASVHIPLEELEQKGLLQSHFLGLITGIEQ